MALGQYMTPGFPGMKSTAEDDIIETLVSAVDLAPGLICHCDAAWQTAYLPSQSGTVAAGPVQHDGEYQYQRAYQANAVSGGVAGAKLPVNVMKKGRCWVIVSTAGGATVTAGAPVKYSNDGTVSDQGTKTLPGAVFRTGIITPTANLGFTALIAEIEVGTTWAGQTPTT